MPPRGTWPGQHPPSGSSSLESCMLRLVALSSPPLKYWEDCTPRDVEDMLSRACSFIRERARQEAVLGTGSKTPSQGTPL